MKKNIKYAIIAIVILLMSILGIAIVYFFINDLESYETEEIKQVCEVKEERYNGRKVFIIKSKQAQNTEKYILYFHGGSYVAEISLLHWEFLEKLAVDTNATIIVPDYPLTPKYHYTHVFNMIEPLYKEIVEKLGSENLIVMGDSAGGGMSLALCEKIGEQGILQPSKLILLSPWLDVRLENPEISEVEKNDKQLNKQALQLAGIAYIGDNENTYLVNPIDGPLDKLKNVIIYTGTYDILNPDVHILKQRANEANIQMQVKEYEGKPHIWLLNSNEAEYEDLIYEIKNISKEEEKGNDINARE